ncbi:MAG: diguanylate cyclase [Treponema sp.]|nr:diguanylate cyclase [Treponema sp.]
MKRIGVLVPAFTIDYVQDFLKGITDYFTGKDVELIIAQTQNKNNNAGLFDYQYWASVSLLKSKSIDAYIIPMGLYTVKMTPETIIKELEEFSPRPIICTAIDIGLPNSYVVLNDCKKAFTDLVSHLKNQHGRKKIAFMSANDTKSAEAFERYEAFKYAMKANDLEFHEEWVFSGGFTDFGAKDELLMKCPTKESVEFDTIVCANDLMAVGSQSALTQLGYSVPEDILITGFDDSSVAVYNKPKLTTINQDISAQAYECGKIAERLFAGEKLPRINYTELTIKYRQSCGCIDMKESDYVYKNQEEQIINELHIKRSLIPIHDNEIHEKMNITTIVDMVNISNTLRQLYYILKFLVGQADLSSMYISLYETPVYFNQKEEIVLPSQAELYMYADNEKNIESFTPGISFAPQKNLFPYSLESGSPGFHIIQPIFAGEGIYGFITCKIKNPACFPSYHVYLKLIVSAISNAFNYTESIVQKEKLTHENTTLEQKSRTDELTGILNRRGFMEIGQRTLDVLQEISSAGVVFFADMDGLKTINDTYGHKMGDKAIKLQAKALKKVFRNTDVVGRLSGDEFGIIANGMLIDYVPEIRKKLDAANEEISIKNKLPFTLSISLGAVDLAKGSTLLTLLAEADKSLYQEKRKKHSKLKKLKQEIDKKVLDDISKTKDSISKTRNKISKTLETKKRKTSSSKKVAE